MAKNSRKKNKNLIMHKKGGTYNLQCDERMRAEHGKKRGDLASCKRNFY